MLADDVMALHVLQFWTQRQRRARSALLPSCYTHSSIVQYNGPSLRHRFTPVNELLPFATELHCDASARSFSASCLRAYSLFLYFFLSYQERGLPQLNLCWCSLQRAFCSPAIHLLHCLISYAFKERFLQVSPLISQVCSSFLQLLFYLQ